MWLLDAWPGGPGALAQQIADGIATTRPSEVGHMHQQLGAAFATESHHGPRAYARFVGTNQATADERATHALHAHAAVQVYLAASAD